MMHAAEPGKEKTHLLSGRLNYRGYRLLLGVRW